MLTLFGLQPRVKGRTLNRGDNLVRGSRSSYEVTRLVPLLGKLSDVLRFLRKIVENVLIKKKNDVVCEVYFVFRIRSFFLTFFFVANTILNIFRIRVLPFKGNDDFILRSVLKNFYHYRMKDLPLNVPFSHPRRVVMILFY